MKSLEPMKPMEPMQPMRPFTTNRWWPESLGDSPASAGGQNDARYAYFADSRRLAIHEGGEVQVFDAGDHRISGVRQEQRDGRRTLVFTSQHGDVNLDSLQPVAG